MEESGKCVVFYSVPKMIDGELYTEKIPFKEFNSSNEADSFIKTSKLSFACMCGYTDIETFDKLYRGKPKIVR